MARESSAIIFRNGRQRLNMQRFDVLSRHQKVDRSYLLEASAGTGKTFAIENIVVRLLIEGEAPLTLEQILVVTFTRAATRDLKHRIRANIENALKSCRWELEDCPDYLQHLLEQGESVVKGAKRRLEHALFCFDQSQIFTIHSFCSRMLREHMFEGDVGLVPDTDVNPLEDSEIISVIRDYFRSEMKDFSVEQLRIVLKDNKNAIENLERELMNILKRGLEIENIESFSKNFEAFKLVMNSLKSFGYAGQKIIEDFRTQAPCYKELCDIKRNIKIENLSKIERFAQLMDQDSWTEEDCDILLEDGVFIIDALDPARKIANKKLEGPLHYPHLYAELKSKLYPLIEKMRDPDSLTARMAFGCQLMLREYLNDEEKLSFDDILKSMQSALGNPRFVQEVRKQYKAAIVDEFQDTDPVQWDIFRTLFQGDNQTGYLYLVGDPKQSIYAFRQADIYTYLSAVEALGEERMASLDTNYRSQPSLVNALNELLANESSPGLVSLPRSGESLEYAKVKASALIDEVDFIDKLGAALFCIAKSQTKYKSFPLEEMETQYFLPFIVKELLQLHQQFNFNQCAILVSDRFQAKRVGDFLQNRGVPVLLQRSGSLADSPALMALRDILQAVIHPKRESYLKIALGSCIIGWTQDDVRSCDSFESITAAFYNLRKTLFSNGFTAFFYELMQSEWFPLCKSVEERLLSQQGGFELHQDLQQIAQLVAEEQFKKHITPESILDFLDQLFLNEEDNPQLLRQQDSDQDAVKVLTIHSSKGLEFDIVFPLGLITRSKVPGKLVLGADGLNVVDQHDERYKKHCEEIDAEKMRQLYVALTRAKHRVYIPAVYCTLMPKMGCASPMELFLARLGRPAAENVESLYERISLAEDHFLRDFIDEAAKRVDLSYVVLEYENTHSSMALISNEYALIPPRKVNVPGTPRLIHSFTMLSKKKSLPEITDTIVEKNVNSLPSGSETGNLLHKLLETLSFNAVREMEDFKQLIPLIHDSVKQSIFAEWESDIAKMLFSALTVTLQAGEQAFRLCDVLAEHCYRETEFLYLANSQNGSQEFLKGVIDLFFSYEGKYYLLDWKSNWLGSAVTDYSEERMKEAMESNDYFLQESIYRTALERYLRVVDKRPFEEIFGGSFYIFLRGIAPQGSTGIYWKQ
jgi:exodeoxyribonuclease V beta subunit